MVQGYGAAGAVVRCKGCDGYSGGVRWAQWKGAVERRKSMVGGVICTGYCRVEIW